MNVHMYTIPSGFRRHKRPDCATYVSPKWGRMKRSSRNRWTSEPAPLPSAQRVAAPTQSHHSSCSEKITPRTYALVSLGYPKNLVDSERMAGLLQREGYRMVAEARRGRTGGGQHLRIHRRRPGRIHEVIEEMLRLKKRGGWER